MPLSGVTRSADQLTEAQKAERRAARAPKIAAAAAKWAACAAARDWDQVRRLGKCFRFAAVKESPRRTPEYKQKVLEAVGLVGDCAGYKHLSKEELAALKEVVSGKADDFWAGTGQWHDGRAYTDQE